MKHIEKTTNQGAFIWVNRILGNYIIFKDHKPIYNPLSAHLSNLYSLQRVIFIGKVFLKKIIGYGDIGFFSVSRNQVIIPFHIKNMSDIRHLKLPAYANCDMLPVEILYFNEPNIGIYTNAIKSGKQYFILEPKFGREYVFKLKQVFPNSRVVIYNESYSKHDIDEFSVFKQDELEEKIDIELIMSQDIDILSKDVLFSARIFIHQKYWEKLSMLPIKLVINSEQAVKISEYLEIEIKNNQVDNSLLSDLKILNQFYLQLSKLLFMKTKQEIVKYLKEVSLSNELIGKLKTALRSQKNRLPYINENIARHSYLEDALFLLEEIRSISS